MPLPIKFRETREGWPLLKVETEVNGDAKSTNERGPFLVGSLGLSWRYKIHCKKSWRSSSTPASGDAGPNDTGVEQIFPHPCRKFYYNYRTFPAFPSNLLFANVELVRQSRKVSKAVCRGAGANLRPTGLQFATLPLGHAFNSYHNNTWCT